MPVVPACPGASPGRPSPTVRCRTDQDPPPGDAALVQDSLPPNESATARDPDRVPEPARNPAVTSRAHLARWENEGGAVLGPVAMPCESGSGVEAAQLRMRVIALENLVIALFADPSAHQRCTAAGMGEFISPRAGCTPHPLTLRAAEAMRSLLERADRFRPGASG